MPDSHSQRDFSRDLQTALDCHQQGELEIAKGRYAELLTALPEHPDLLHLLGVVNHQLGEHDVAESLVRRAIEGNVADAFYRNSLGEILMAQGRFAEALACYQRAVTLNPAVAEFRAGLENAQACLAERAPPSAAASAGEAQWSLNVGILAGGSAMTGLAPLEINIACTGNPTPQACQLRIDFPDSGHAEAVIPVQLQAGRAVCRCAIHTHLLDNGPRRFHVQLLNAAGVPVAVQQGVLDVRNEGAIAVQVRNSLRAAKVPLVLDGPCDAGRYDYADTSLTPWFDRPDAADTIHAWLAARTITFAEAESLLGFVNDGYMVLPGLIEDELLDSINREIDHVIATGYQGYEHGSGKRLEHLHTAYPGVRRLWMHPRVLHFLDLIFAARARPCQSLTFICGSEQQVHQDTVHLTPFPAGYMCGVWTALEDVQPGSGELEVYPGSHRLPRIYMHDSGAAKVSAGDWTEFSDKVGRRWQTLRDQGRFESVVYRPTRGTVLIWHENLMHAGGKRLDHSLTRRSIVTHNFAEGALVFYDSTGNIGYTFDRDS